MTTRSTTLNLFALAILFTTISIVNAQAQTPGAAPNEPSSAAVRPEFRVTDLLARAVRNKRNSLNARAAFFSPESVTPAPTLLNIVPAAPPPRPVTGSGTLGRVTKWTASDSALSAIGDTTIFEDPTGNVGIGTDTPTSRLSVAGTIQSLSGGFKFPDGTVQSSSAAGALSFVAHDATLMGSGSLASPLGVASPLMIRDQDNPAKQPFQREASCSTTDPSCIVPIIVPAGKRLVIEYVSMQASIPAGELAQLVVNTAANGNVVSHPLALSSPAIPFGLTTKTIIGQQVRIYADPGFMNLVGERSSSGGSVTFIFSISGYLVDLP